MAVPGPQYKVILLGDPGVGKTTFFLRLRDSSFVDTENRPTASLGVEDMQYKHRIGDTEITVRIQVPTTVSCLYAFCFACSVISMTLVEGKGLELSLQTFTGMLLQPY